MEFSDLISWRDAMYKANDLLHLYRNAPASVTNNARQVDPVIRDLRVALAQVEDKISGGSFS
jgi:hypothetical protein